MFFYCVILQKGNIYPFCFRVSEKEKISVMSQNQGKGINFFLIIIVLVFLSYGSSLLSSMARIPQDMTKALLTGEPYTGKLEQVVDPYGQIHWGITYAKEEGSQGVIVADRVSDLTLDYFSQADQVVLMDKKGATFWLTYEDLGIAYAVLLVGFFVLRLVISLLLSLLVVVSKTNIKAVRKGKIALGLLLKPVRLVVFGYILTVFYQDRIFAYEEEQSFFTAFLAIYGFYFLVVVLLRVQRARKYWRTQPEIQRHTNRYENTAAIVDDRATVLDTTTKHDNDLIQREKRTFKHETSRYK